MFEFVRGGADVDVGLFACFPDDRECECGVLVGVVADVVSGTSVETIDEVLLADKVVLNATDDGGQDDLEAVGALIYWRREWGPRIPRNERVMGEGGGEGN